MDGMTVTYQSVSTGGRGEISFSETIKTSPISTIAEISLSTFDTTDRSPSFGIPVTAFAVFTACTTDGTNPPLSPSETFSFFGGSLSGHPRPVLIRSGLTSLTYEIDVANCAADFVINLFFWPSVVRGNL